MGAEGPQLYTSAKSNTLSPQLYTSIKKNTLSACWGEHLTRRARAHGAEI